MSASALQLAGLPTETLEHVLLHLSVQDVIKMEAVNRRFQGLIRNSPTLQYRRELFVASLIENSCNPCSLAQGRKLCGDYVHKWSKTAVVVKSTHNLHPNHAPRRIYARNLGRNMLAAYPTGNHGLGFLHIPPITSRKPIDTWNIPQFPFAICGFAIDHSRDLIAVAERDGNLLRIRFLNLRDGSPYSPLPSDTLTWDIPQDIPPILTGGLGITDSRVAVYLSHGSLGGTKTTVLVWDRKTGDLVLSLPTMNLMGLGASEVIFLDEFRTVCTTRDPGTGSTQFIVFNTLVPQDHPMSSRRLNLPPQYDTDRDAHMHADQDRSLGTLDRDRPIITDPSQEILVVRLTKLYHGDILFVVRIQPLIECVCSTRTDVHIPWDEWGRGAVTIENRLRYGFDVYIHGTRLVLLETLRHHRLTQGLRVRTFDFGRRACSALPLWDQDGGAVRKTSFSDGSEFVLEATGTRPPIPWGSTGSQGDGNFFQMLLSDGPGSDTILNVWELT